MSIEAAPIAGTAARLDRIIAANYGRLPSRDLARRLGMPTLRLIGHARRLGLLRPVTFTEAQRALIRRHYRPDDPAAIAALVAVTGKPRWQVTREARCMGLSRRAPPRWWRTAAMAGPSP